MSIYNLKSQVRDAMKTASDEILALEQIEYLRRTDTAQFLRTLTILFKRNQSTAAYVFTKLSLSNDERWNLAIELYDAGAITKEATESVHEGIDENLKQIERDRLKQKAEKEILDTAIQALLDKNPKWKKYDLQRFADARIKSHFTKEPKPFTSQHVKAGAEWSISTRKKITEQKAETNKGPRRRFNIPHRIWERFFRLQGWPQSPEFADKFIKSVNAEVRKQEKVKAAQIATN